MLRRPDLAILKRAHPLPGVVAGYEVALCRSGQVLLGRCPFHDDHEPSLLVDPHDDHFHCFGCRAHGDLLDFVRRMERTDFRGAVERLSRCPERAAIPARDTAAPPNGWFAARRSPPAWNLKERACLTSAVELYEQQLRAEPKARAYLRCRGLTPETIARHRLGYAVGGTLAADLRRTGLPIADARRVGLLDRQDREHLRGRLIIPELRDGQPVWLIGRAVGSDGGRRYLGLPGRKPLLGWEAAVGAPLVFVTEGPFDWLVLRQWGYPALALVGAHARPDLLRSLKQFPCLALVLDNDAAGQAGATTLEQVLGPRAHRVALPDGVKDVAELGAWPDGQARFASSVRQTELPVAA